MAAGNFFGGEFFGGGFFGANAPSGPPLGGKGDNERGRQTVRLPVKPTGLLDRPRKPQKEGRKDVADRVDESARINAEVAERLAEDFKQGNLQRPQEAQTPPVAEMSLAEIEQEIGAILRKKIRTEEDEMMLLMLMAAGSA